LNIDTEFAGTLLKIVTFQYLFHIPLSLGNRGRGIISCSYRKQKTENRKQFSPSRISRGGPLVAAFVPGANDLLAFFHEPGVLALGAGLFLGRLVHGEIALGVLAAAVKNPPAGPSFRQVAAAAFPGTPVGGLVFRGLGEYLTLGVPGKILGESAFGIAGAAQKLS
jgi:hypothetical protein